MKPIYYVPLLICVVYCSCVTYAQYDNKAAAARDQGSQAFITMSDGKTISGSTLKYRTYNPYDHHLALFSDKDDAFTIDGKNYSGKGVVAFQDKNAYHKLSGDAYLVRIVKGRINLYYFDEIRRRYDGTKYKVENFSHYYFDKRDDKVAAIGVSELKEAVKDNQRASALLAEYYPRNNYAKQLSVEKLTAVVNAYNQ